MDFNLPVRRNKKLSTLIKNIKKDQELQQLWKCANINAVDRSGITDHGDVHIRIVANAALKMLRLLAKKDVKPSVVVSYGLTIDDAEVIVVLAACLHDVGISIHRNNHERLSLYLAYPKAKELLSKIYSEPELTIMVSEVMHAIVAHNVKETCLTIEAGILKVADALDMSQGRSRIPFEIGQINIHSVSAQAVDSVEITEGEKLPIRIIIRLINPAGIFQVDELLKRKLNNSSILDYTEIVTENKSS